MLAFVIASALRPGLIDLDNEAEALDTTLSIEQLKVAEAITEEQQRQAEQAAKEYEQEFTRQGGLLLNPFDWAAEHETGGDWS